MANFIALNQVLLEERHYIRRASADNYWFDFTRGRMKGFQQRYDDRFCVIVFGSADFDDAYVIPYSVVAPHFLEEEVDDRNRWFGTIRNDILRLPAAPGRRQITRMLDVCEYYNAFNLLDVGDPDAQDLALAEKAAQKSVDRGRLKDLIAAFNIRHVNATPQRRAGISYNIGRPNSISRYLKEYHSSICQLCGAVPFIQQNGNPYAEAHHINELHRLLPGSLCSDNIVIVCANCHRQLHYAPAKFDVVDDLTVHVTLAGTNRVFTRNRLTDIWQKREDGMLSD